MNDVNLETQAADARVQFKVFAAVDANGLPDMTLTFADLDINEVYIGLRVFGDTPDTTGDTAEPMRPGGAVSDKTKPFTIVEVILPLAKRYLWTRNITRNASGKEFNIPGTPVDFYAGGDIATTGMPEFSGGTTDTPTGGLFTIAAVQLDNAHTEVQVRVKQRGASQLAILLKRILLFKTIPSGTQKNIETIKLLDEESVFVRTADVTFIREIKHVANKTGIMYGARMIGVGHTVALPIQRDASMAMADSTFSIAPSAPAVGLFATAPDSDTDEANDSFADFTIFASATNPSATFADTGANIVYVVLRKFSGTGASDDDINDNRLPKYPFPIEDLNVTNVVCRVRNLKTGRQYVWQRNISERAGSIVKSVTGTTFTFRAGSMIIDPASVTISIVSITQVGTSFVVRVRIIQTTMPVLLRSVSLFKDKNDGQGFIEIANSKVRIKDKPEFQIALANQTLDIEINALKNTTVSLRARVTAVGGLSKDSTAVPGVATGGSPPTMQPSFPMAADIVLNTVQADISTGIAIVTFRIFASWMRATTGQGGTGPGGSISFNDVSADAAAAVIADAMTSGQGQEFKAADFDPTQNFADVTAEFTIGKAYLYRRNITFREGVPSKSQITNVNFNAGGRAGVNGFPGLTFTLALAQVLDSSGGIDNTQVEAQLNITQPASPYLLKAFEIERKRNILDSVYKLVIPRERILDDITYQTTGVKPTISRIIPIPKKGTYNVRARLIGLGDGVGGGPVRLDSNIVNSTTLDNPGATDPGRPQYSGQTVPPPNTGSLTPRLRAQWRKQAITIKCNLPDVNMLTHITCYASFEFQSRPFGSLVRQFWNPDTGENFQGFGLIFPDPVFHIDLGKTLKTGFDVERPLISSPSPPATYTNPDASGNPGDLPLAIASNLLASFNAGFGSSTVLIITLITMNRFNPGVPLSSVISVLAESIPFPFDPKNMQLADMWTVS